MSSAGRLVRVRRRVGLEDRATTAKANLLDPAAWWSPLNTEYEPRRTALLALEPGAQTLEVEDMAAGELLGRHVRTISRWLLLLVFCTVRRLGFWSRLIGSVTGLHLLAADDASTIGHLREFSFCCVGISPVHVAGSIVVADERAEAGDEGARSDENVTDDVQGKTVEGEDDHEERHVGCELEEICRNV